VRFPWISMDFCVLHWGCDMLWLLRGNFEHVGYLVKATYLSWTLPGATGSSSAVLRWHPPLRNYGLIGDLHTVFASAQYWGNGVRNTQISTTKLPPPFLQLNHLSKWIQMVQHFFGLPDYLRTSTSAALHA
jgi:hypothetical protein